MTDQASHETTDRAIDDAPRGHSSLIDRLTRLSADDRHRIIDDLSDDECRALLYDWRGAWARPDQIEPEGDWSIWAVIAGRGYGKTRTGAEWIRERVAGGARHIALVGKTAADVRDVMVEGPSGLLSTYPPDDRPLYEPSKRRVTWRNGAIGILYNATEPDQLRGPQHDTAWCDELAKWSYAQSTWDQLQFGMRVGQGPRQIVTTTPRPIALVRDIVSGALGRVHVTRGRTMDNRGNLAAGFLDQITARYGGTRLGRQELDGEILGDTPGALWRQSDIDIYRVAGPPDRMGRIVVAIDPAVTDSETSDEHGIIAAGIATDGDERIGYVLEDGSARGTPLEWARRAIALYDRYSADAIIIETNQGGDMVAQTLRSIRREIKIIEVRATRGKHVRAEPIAALYEQGRVRHAATSTNLAQLEQQMTQMTQSGYVGEGSPDRVDALVWALTDLFPAIVRPAPRAVAHPETRWSRSGWR